MENDLLKWKKKSFADRSNISSHVNEGELTQTQMLLTDKAELERELRKLNNKLTSALAECNAKDDFAKKQVKIAREAIAGWEKAETEAISLKQELDNVLQQREAAEEKMVYLDAALKECMRHLQFVREDQEKRIHGALMKMSNEFENTKITLDEKLVEDDKKLAELGAENTQLRKALLGKDKLIEDLNKYRAQIEADFNALASRTETIKKANASLRYEVRLLEKESDICHEEREFNRLNSDVVQKQNVTQCEMIDFLTEQLHVMTEEKGALKETLNKKPKKLETSRTYPRPTSRLSQASLSDLGSDDKASCRESWASALISELEHFKTEKQSDTSSQRIIGTSEMELMDDFVEMEKLAVVSDDYPTGSSYHSSEGDNAISRPSGLVSSHESLSANKVVNKEPSWLGDALKLVLEQSSTTERSTSEVLDDIKAALAHINTSNPRSLDAKFSGHVNHKLGNNALNTEASVRGTPSNISTTKKSSQKFQSSVTISVHRLLELIEGISMPYKEKSVADDKIFPCKNSELTTGFVVRVFQWKFSELSSILQQFVCTCKDLLNGTAYLEQFVQQVASTLEWIMNHCFSLQDVSSMKEAMRNHFDWDESESESELDSELINHCAQSNKLLLERNEMNVQQDGRLNVELMNKESSTADLEVKSLSEILNSESFMVHMQESGNSGTLQSEFETKTLSRRKTEDQIQNNKILKEDFNTLLKDANLELNKEISCLEDQSEKRNDLSTVKGTCIGVRIQLNGMTSKEVPDDRTPGERQLLNDWEVKGASQMGAKCQETAKKVKDLASPTEAAPFDKVILTSKRNISRRTSLFDKMMAEDNNVEICDLNISSNEEHIQGDVSTNAIMLFKSSSRVNHERGRTMAVSPCKKKDSRSLLKKLLCIRKKGGSKKLSD